MAKYIYPAIFSLMLTHLEDKGCKIPVASEINDLNTENGAFATYISCVTTAY